MDERWLPIPGYEGLYEVSDLGRVRSVARVVDRGGRPLTVPGKMLRPLKHGGGYRMVNLWRDGEGRFLLVHQLVLRAFVGPPPEKHIGLHGLGGPTDNRLSNLRWGTYADNMRDAVLHGAHANASRTACRRGHPLSGPNLVPSALVRGRRSCLACHRALSNVADARRSGRPVPDLQELSDIKFAQIMEGAAA